MFDTHFSMIKLFGENLIVMSIAYSSTPKPDPVEPGPVFILIRSNFGLTGNPFIARISIGIDIDFNHAILAWG